MNTRLADGPLAGPGGGMPGAGVVDAESVSLQDGAAPSFDPVVGDMDLPNLLGLSGGAGVSSIDAGQEFVAMLAQSQASASDFGGPRAHGAQAMGHEQGTTMGPPFSLNGPPRDQSGVMQPGLSSDSTFSQMPQHSQHSFLLPRQHEQPHQHQHQPQDIGTAPHGAIPMMMNTSHDSLSGHRMPNQHSHAPFTPAQTLALIANIDGGNSVSDATLGAQAGMIRHSSIPKQPSGQLLMPMPPCAQPAPKLEPLIEPSKPVKARTGASIGGSAAGSTRKAKFRRSRTGCLVCRKRKVKCDQDGIPCKQCRIGQRNCHYEESPAKRKRKPKSASQDVPASKEGTPVLTKAGSRRRKPSSSPRRKSSKAAAGGLKRANGFASGEPASQLGASPLTTAMNHNDRSAIAALQVSLGLGANPMGAPEASRLDENELFAAHTHIDDLSDSEQLRNLGEARRLSDDADQNHSDGSTVRSSVDDDASLAYTHDSDSRDSLGKWTNASSVYTSFSAADEWSLGALKVQDAHTLPFAIDNAKPHDFAGQGIMGSTDALSLGALGDVSGVSGDSTLGAYARNDTLLSDATPMEPATTDVGKLTWSPQIISATAQVSSGAAAAAATAASAVPFS